MYEIYFEPRNQNTCIYRMASATNLYTKHYDSKPYSSNICSYQTALYSNLNLKSLWKYWTWIYSVMYRVINAASPSISSLAATAGFAVSFCAYSGNTVASLLTDTSWWLSMSQALHAREHNTRTQCNQLFNTVHALLRRVHNNCWHNVDVTIEIKFIPT